MSPGAGDTEPSLSVTTLDLLRHGEPVGGRRYRGQIDDPLSETGWRQMWAAVGDEVLWQRIVTSPLRRCSEFARELAAQHKLPLQEDARLREIGFGVWEGRTAAELRDEDPMQLQRFYHDPLGARPAGAEPLADFSARACAAYADLLRDYAGESVLVVTHAGVIRALIAHVLQAPLTAMYRIHVPSAGLSRITVDGERPPTLVRHGGGP